MALASCLRRRRGSSLVWPVVRCGAITSFSVHRERSPVCPAPATRQCNKAAGHARAGSQPGTDETRNQQGQIGTHWRWPGARQTDVTCQQHASSSLGKDSPEWDWESATTPIHTVSKPPSGSLRCTYFYHSLTTHSRSNTLADLRILRSETSSSRNLQIGHRDPLVSRDLPCTHTLDNGLADVNRTSVCPRH